MIAKTTLTNVSITTIHPATCATTAPPSHPGKDSVPSTIAKPTEKLKSQPRTVTKPKVVKAPADKKPAKKIIRTKGIKKT